MNTATSRSAHRASNALPRELFTIRQRQSADDFGESRDDRKGDARAICDNE